MKVLYAHSANKLGEWNTLKNHLLNTAKLSFEICKIERLKNIAYVLGLFHDLGKSYEQFQDRVTGKSKVSFDHPGFSIYLIEKKFPEIHLNNRLKEIIRGHHQGLNNIINKERSLEEKIGIPEQVEIFIESLKPYIIYIEKEKITYHDSLYLASCLFVSDWCDTSKHFLTYEKKQKVISINVEENIEEYVNAISK